MAPIKRLLCLSNGHGEDTIAVRILQALQQQPQAPEILALPLVGEGQAYTCARIPLLSPGRTMPSGGFVYMDGRQLWRDIRGGLFPLLWQQWRTIRNWRQQGGWVLAVGDIVPLLLAWWSGMPYGFVGTAKSEYYLRDEVGLLPRRSWFERLESWSGSVYLPWERWLMRQPRCRAVFPRDRLTTLILKRWSIPAVDLGNPMVDDLEPTHDLRTLIPTESALTLVLLPGSRVPEAYHNWQSILQALASLIHQPTREDLLILGAIAPHVELPPIITALVQHGWQVQSPSPSELSIAVERFRQGTITLLLTQHAYNDCLHYAHAAIAMAGTATEQFVGLGKPVITFPGQGPQFTHAFAEAQARHLGPSVTLVCQPSQVAPALKSLLQDPDRLDLIATNGYQRMGTPGAAQRIAQHLQRFLVNSDPAHRH